MKLDHLGLLFMMIGFAILAKIADLSYALALTSLAIGVGLMNGADR